MSDKKISIDFKLNADTSGAKQTKQALEDVQKTAAKGLTVDGGGFDAAIAKAKELRAAIEDLPSLAETGKAETGIDVASFRMIDEETQKAVDSLKGLGDAAVEAMTKAAQAGDTASLERYAEELDYIKAAYDQIADGKPFENMSEAPGKVLDEYEQALERVDRKVQEMASKPVKMPDYKAQQEAFMQAALELDEQIKKEKELEKTKKGASQSAQRAADVMIAAQKRVGMSVEELRAEYERYSQALRDARTEGDKEGMRTQIAHLRVLKTEIKSAEAALNKVPSSFDKTGKAAVKAGYMLQSLQGGIRGVIHNIPSLTMALGGGMGLAGALTALTVVGTAAFSKLKEKMDQFEKDQAERLDKLKTKAEDASKELGSVKLDIRNDDLDKQLKSELDRINDLTDGYKRQRTAIELAYQSKLKLLGQQEDEATIQDRIRQAELDLAYEQGGITEADYRKQSLEIRMAGERRRFEASYAKAKLNESSALANRNTTQQELNSIDAKINDLDNLNLPGANEAAALFRQIDAYTANNDRVRGNLSHLEGRIRDVLRWSPKKDWTFFSGSEIEHALDLLASNPEESKYPITSQLVWPGTREKIKTFIDDYTYNQKQFKPINSADLVKRNQLQDMASESLGVEATFEDVKKWLESMEKKRAELEAKRAGVAQTLEVDNQSLVMAQQETQYAKKRNDLGVRAIDTESKVETAKIDKDAEIEKLKKRQDKIEEKLKKDEEKRKKLQEKIKPGNIGGRGLSQKMGEDNSPIRDVFEDLIKAAEDGAFLESSTGNNQLKDFSKRLGNALNESGVFSGSDTWNEAVKLMGELASEYHALDNSIKKQKDDLERIKGTIKTKESPTAPTTTEQRQEAAPARRGLPVPQVEQVSQVETMSNQVATTGANATASLNTLFGRMVTLITQMQQAQAQMLASMTQNGARVDKLERNWEKLQWELDRIRRR